MPRRRPEPAATAGIAVEVSDTQGHLRVEAGALEGLARRVLAGEGVSRASLSIALVDDAAIHAINRAHLGHDYPTDVITFPLSAPGESALSAELVISAETATVEAARRGRSPQDELALYAVHGLLHLCGYDDHDPADAAAMRRREAEVLGRPGLAPVAGAGGES